MNRRVEPAPTDELFRPTHDDVEATPSSGSVSGAVSGPVASSKASSEAAGEPGTSGRERHDSKITVYVSADEFLALERAKLTLRGQHRVAVDRGRIVREAIAVVLADLDSQGSDSILVRRLQGG